MQNLLEGVLLGLTLSILLGPIFIVLIQSSFERGARAGLTAASGIWTSDILIVSISLYFIKKISFLVQHPTFVFWMGLVGGLVLIGVGMVTVKRKVNIDFTKSSLGAGTLFNFWLKGFLVNTINPFTFIFWLTMISSYIATRNLNQSETYLFLSGILSMIILTDIAKVLMAKFIRARINDKLLFYINMIAGTSLIIIGFVMIIKGLK